MQSFPLFRKLETVASLEGGKRAKGLFSGNPRCVSAACNPSTVTCFSVLHAFVHGARTHGLSLSLFFGFVFGTYRKSRLKPIFAARTFDRSVSIVNIAFSGTCARPELPFAVPSVLHTHCHVLTYTFAALHITTAHPPCVRSKAFVVRGTPRFSGSAKSFSKHSFTMSSTDVVRKSRVSFVHFQLENVRRPLYARSPRFQTVRRCFDSMSSPTRRPSSFAPRTVRRTGERELRKSHNGLVRKVNAAKRKT